MCNKTKLLQFLTQTCPNLKYKYIFVIGLCCSYYNFCNLGWGYLTSTESRDSLICDHVICKKKLSPPPLTMATGNLVNLGSTSETSPVKNEFLASYSKQNFWQFWQKIEKNQHSDFPQKVLFYSFLQICVKYFLKYCWSSRTKLKLFLQLISLNGYMIYDETCNAAMHQRFGIRWNKYLLNLISRNWT